jgi:hypothetical protein
VRETLPFHGDDDERSIHRGRSRVDRAPTRQTMGLEQGIEVRRHVHLDPMRASPSANSWRKDLLRYSFVRAFSLLLTTSLRFRVDCASVAHWSLAERAANESRRPEVPLSYGTSITHAAMAARYRRSHPMVMSCQARPAAIWSATCPKSANAQTAKSKRYSPLERIAAWGHEGCAGYDTGPVTLMRRIREGARSPQVR